MMFSSSPLDKNCIDSDSCSSSRNNAPNRFSVGIAPLGDENQQIRIQLAVHKYNGTTGSPFNNRCSFMSPIRHSFLKNSLKARNYEGDHEGTSKTDKRNGNQYEGVGAFPTIHLKKNALRYRPIRRFHDVKIPHPELPVNRFLSHLPEVCPDLKSTSTRSYLDVLEDLSGNKIHSKEDNGCSKPKLQGLGGDYLLNPNAVFKPLFVQKPKLNAVLTRDNTTQTLSPVSMEMPSSQGSSSLHVRNGPLDPRAELRRKLAKQNNEIFASLSSSISSAFSLKRKIDKVVPSKDDGQLGEGSALKKTKMSNHRGRESNENGLAKSATASAVNSTESVKLSKKSKFSGDANSLSPNKDRLTTIFLDTRNTSPKARVFQANTSSESKSTEKGSQVTSTCQSETNGESADKTESPLASSFGGGCGRNERTHGSASSGSSEKSDKQEGGQSDKPVVSSPACKSVAGTKDAAQSTASPLRLGVTAADSSSFTSPKAVTGNVAYSSEPSKSTGSGNDSNKEQNDGTGKGMSGGFSFGKTVCHKPVFGAFKFGVDGGTPLAQNKVLLTDVKGSSSEPAPTANIEPSNSTTQFSLGTSVTASPLQTSALCFGTTGSQNTFASPGKTTFTFGCTAPPSQQASTNTEGKLKESVTTSTPSAATAPAQPATFTFGQKPIVSSAPTGHVSPAPTVSAPASLNNNSWSSPSSGGSAFASEQKPELSATSGGAAPVVEGQMKTSPFVFGQKETESESGPKSASVFSAVSQSSTQGSGVTTDAAAPNQPSAAQKNQPFAQVVSTATAAPQVTIGQNSVSECSTTFGTKFGGGSSKGLPASELDPANPVFPNKTVSFGSSLNAFGKTTTQTTTGFTTSTSGAPAFGFQVPATTQSIPPFGVSPAVQSGPTFGSSSTTQSAPTFGPSSTTQSAPTFGPSSTTQSAPTFGPSSTTQSAPTFGPSSTTQSAPTFGPSSTTQSITAFASAPAAQAAPAFGAPASHSTPGFVVSPTTQTPPSFGASSAPHSAPAFGSSNKQLLPSFGTISTTQSTTPTFPASSQPSFPFGTPATTQSTVAPLMGFKLPSSNNASTLFGTPTSTQSPVRFGPTTTQNNIAFGPSPGFTAPFPTQPTTSAPAFPASHSLDNKPLPCPSSANMFAQNPSPVFSSTNVFTSSQNNIFARKPAAETSMLEQNKAQTCGFGSTPQGFASQNKFSFGTSTSNATGFTTSPPTTTAPMVYSFGGGTTGNTFTFGGSSSAPNTTQTPFAFGSPASEPFKFGATTTAAATTTTTTTATAAKEGGAPFGGAASTTFSFAGQMSNPPPVAEQKPSFNFGGAQASTAGAGFHFGTTPSPSVFNFGGSSSSGSSGSSFNFGTPTSGVGFGQAASPGAPFAVPGTFNIGSGSSSQSRPRASSRPRRRP